MQAISVLCAWPWAGLTAFCATGPVQASLRGSQVLSRPGGTWTLALSRPWCYELSWPCAGPWRTLWSRSGPALRIRHPGDWLPLLGLDRCDHPCLRRCQVELDLRAQLAWMLQPPRTPTSPCSVALLQTIRSGESDWPSMWWRWGWRRRKLKACFPSLAHWRAQLGGSWRTFRSRTLRRQELSRRCSRSSTRPSSTTSLFSCQLTSTSTSLDFIDAPANRCSSSPLSTTISTTSSPTTTWPFLEKFKDGTCWEGPVWQGSRESWSLPKPRRWNATKCKKPCSCYLDRTTRRSLVEDNINIIAVSAGRGEPTPPTMKMTTMTLSPMIGPMMMVGKRDTTNGMTHNPMPPHWLVTAMWTRPSRTSTTMLLTTRPWMMLTQLSRRKSLTRPTLRTWTLGSASTRSSSAVDTFP